MPKKKPFEDRNIRGDNKSFRSDLSLSPSLCKFEQIYLRSLGLPYALSQHVPSWYFTFEGAGRKNRRVLPVRSVRTKRKERLKLHQENSLQEKVTFKEGSNRLNSNGQSFTYFTHIQPCFKLHPKCEFILIIMFMQYVPSHKIFLYRNENDQEHSWKFPNFQYMYIISKRNLSSLWILHVRKKHSN